MKRIVVATDGSEGSARAVDIAADFAAQLGAKLSIVAVAPSATALAEELEPFARAEGLANELPRLLSSLEPTFLEPMQNRARARGAFDIAVHTAAGDPADGILAFALEHGADLIVVGSRGRGRLRGLLLGSVSQKVATHAACSVLIAR